MRKAQASLEMVIGLIILLVVAGVVISLVLFFMKPEQVQSITGGIEWNKFIQDCRAKCEAKQYADYCQMYWSGDYNKNKLYPEAIQVGEYKWYTCEDRIYCFLVAPCEELGRGREVIENCRNILCQTFIDKYGDATTAANAVKDVIKLSEKQMCISRYNSKAQGLENWYSDYFANPDCTSFGAGGTGGTPGSTTFTPDVYACDDSVCGGNVGSDQYCACDDEDCTTNCRIVNIVDQENCGFPAGTVPIIDGTLVDCVEDNGNYKIIKP